MCVLFCWVERGKSFEEKDDDDYGVFRRTSV